MRQKDNAILIYYKGEHKLFMRDAKQVVEEMMRLNVKEVEGEFEDLLRSGMVVKLNCEVAKEKRCAWNIEYTRKYDAITTLMSLEITAPNSSLQERLAKRKISRPSRPPWYLSAMSSIFSSHSSLTRSTLSTPTHSSCFSFKNVIEVNTIKGIVIT